MNTTPIRIIPVALVLALAACQQQPKPAPQVPPPQHSTAMQPAPEPGQATPATKPESTMPKAETAAPVTAVKPATPASKPEATAVMPAKPSAPSPAAPKPAASAATTAKPQAPSVKREATAAPTFSTTRCMACHAIDHDKVGPAWKTVVEKYGSEAALARDFEAGFKERRVANAIDKWKAKEGLMTMQYRNLIEGHGKEAAHALFETVKHGKFGSY